MQVNGSNKAGLNELLAAMLNNENKDIPYHELNELLHRIEEDAIEIYHRKLNLVQMTQKLNLV
ncbi:MAG: hypothetical protein ACRD8W_11420 [Nitrososphaeraceae archaeon]